MSEMSDDGPTGAPARTCQCGCGRELTGSQTMYASGPCKFKAFRARGKKREAGEPITLAPLTPPVTFVPKHGGGLLQQSQRGDGIDRHRRPSNAMRAKFCDVLNELLDEVQRRVDASRRQSYDKATLQSIPKETLIELMLEYDEWLALSVGDLRQLLDTCAKYGIGTKHVHAGDEDGSTVTGVIILPAFNTES